MKRKLFILILAGITAYIVWYVSDRIEPFAARLLTVKLLLGVLGIVSLVMAVRYLLSLRRAAHLPHHGTGTVVRVEQNTGFDSSYAIGRSVVPGYGFREQGQGGSWTWFFMLWNEIRPDNWFPILQTEKGEATIRYGGFRNTWREGDVIPVAWDDDSSGIVYPEKSGWLVRKALLATLCSAALLFLGFFRMPALMRAFQAEDCHMRQTISEVYNGFPCRYDGDVTQSDTAIVFEFTALDGSYSIPFDAEEGTWWFAVREDLSGKQNNRVEAAIEYEASIADHPYSVSDLFVFSDTLPGCYDFGSCRIPAPGSGHRLVIRGRAEEGRVTVTRAVFPDDFYVCPSCGDQAGKAEAVYPGRVQPGSRADLSRGVFVYKLKCYVCGGTWEYEVPLSLPATGRQEDCPRYRW